MAKRKTSKAETEDTTPTLQPDTELLFIYNEDTGELRQVVARAGYAPTPMPHGFRLARNEEVPGK